MFSQLKNIFRNHNMITEKLIIKLLVLVLVSFIALIVQNILMDDYEANLSSFWVTMSALGLGAYVSDNIGGGLSPHMTRTKRQD